MGNTLNAFYGFKLSGRRMHEQVLQKVFKGPKQNGATVRKAEVDPRLQSATNTPPCAPLCHNFVGHSEKELTFSFCLWW